MDETPRAYAGTADASQRHEQAALIALLHAMTPAWPDVTADVLEGGQPLPAAGLLLAAITDLPGTARAIRDLGEIEVFLAALPGRIAGSRASAARCTTPHSPAVPGISVTARRQASFWTRKITTIIMRA